MHVLSLARIEAMPSVLVSFREAKEPVDSGWPYLKIPDKRKREESKSQKVQKAERRRKSQSSKRKGYAKRGAVKVSRRTWFLVVWVPNINKILPKRDYK